MAYAKNFIWPYSTHMPFPNFLRQPYSHMMVIYPYTKPLRQPYTHMLKLHMAICCLQIFTKKTIIALILEKTNFRDSTINETF